MTDKAYQQWRDQEMYGIGLMHGKPWVQRVLYHAGNLVGLFLLWVVLGIIGWALIFLVTLLLP